MTLFMIFFFFLLSVFAMLFLMLRAITALLGRNVERDPAEMLKRSMYRALAVGIPLTFLLLIFVLPASITRYEVNYPVCLILLSIQPIIRTRRGSYELLLQTAVIALTLAQFAGCLVYLMQDTVSADLLAVKYDSVVDCIPVGARVAASPQLWLAFERKDRPFTLLYPKLDGMDNWTHEFDAPLQNFDLILLSDYVQSDLDFYTPLSEPGRVEQDVKMGSHVIHIYARGASFNRACLTEAGRSASLSGR